MEGEVPLWVLISPYHPPPHPRFSCGILRCQMYTTLVEYTKTLFIIFFGGFVILSRVGDLCGYSAAAATASAAFLKMFRCPQRNGISGHHLHELVRWPASPSRRSDLVAGVASVRVGQVLCFSNVSKAACNSEEGVAGVLGES